VQFSKPCSHHDIIHGIISKCIKNINEELTVAKVEKLELSMLFENKAYCFIEFSLEWAVSTNSAVEDYLYMECIN